MVINKNMDTYFNNFTLTDTLNPQDIIIIYDGTTIKSIALSSFYTNVLQIDMLKNTT